MKQRVAVLERALVASEGDVERLQCELFNMKLDRSVTINRFGRMQSHAQILERELAETKKELNDKRKFCYAVEQALDGLKGDYVEIIKELRKDAEKYRLCFNFAVRAAMKECGK